MCPNVPENCADHAITFIADFVYRTADDDYLIVCNSFNCSALKWSAHNFSILNEFPFVNTENGKK